MIFKFFLILALGVLALYAYFQSRRAPMVSLSVLGLAAIGIVLAAAPDLATTLAQTVGIGRGADLVIYCFVLISLAAIFNLHLKLRANETNVTQLVRAIAMMNATIASDAKSRPGDDAAH